MKQYKILIISATNGKPVIEDLLLAKSFREDGHFVKVMAIDYNHLYDKKFDLIIRRNTWDENKEKSDYYRIRCNMIKERLLYKEINPVGIFGFQEKYHQYLVRMTNARIPHVLPTLGELVHLAFVDEYYDSDDFVLVDCDEYIAKSRFNIKVKKKKIADIINDMHLIQADFKYSSQVQFHFIGDELMYAFEYTPSKYSKYSSEKLIKITDKDREVAEYFGKRTGLKYGMQRLDFIRTKDGEIYLTEINDTNVKMNFDKLDSNTMEKVFSKFKKLMYEYIELDNFTQFCEMDMRLNGEKLYNK